MVNLFDAPQFAHFGMTGGRSSVECALERGGLSGRIFRLYVQSESSRLVVLDEVLAATAQHFRV